MSTLSICLITKDEESNIGKCLNSIKHISDEIIIVDTGSTDNTVKIAKELGAKVYYKKWENDFSKARNYALSHCTKEWVLMIDADETISYDDCNKLKKILDTNEYLDGIYLRLCNFISDIIINETASLRVFKNNINHKYIGRLHEQIYFSIIENNPKAKLMTTDIVLNHFGYDHNHVDMGKKIQRNIEVLEGSTEKEKDGFFFFNLATEYSKLGNLEKAKENYLLAISVPSKDYGYKPFLSIALCKILFSLNEFSTSINYANIFSEEMPDFKDIYFIKAMCYHSIFKFTLAFESMLKYIGTQSNYNKYPNFNIENENDISGITHWLAQNKSGYKKGTLTILLNPSNVFEDYSKTLEACNDICDEIIVLNNYTLKEKREFEVTQVKDITSYNITSKWLLKLSSSFEPTLTDKKEILTLLSTKNEDFTFNSLNFIKI